MTTVLQSAVGIVAFALKVLLFVQPYVQRMIVGLGIKSIVAGTLATMMTGLFWHPASARDARTAALCIGEAPSTVQAKVPVTSFTLAWVHSVEKIRWEEDYRIERGQLTLTAARVRGSGAGMEPPEGAVLRDGAWEYVPAQTVFPKLRLTRSTFTRDYELCWNGECREFATLVGKPGAGETIELFPCQF